MYFSDLEKQIVEFFALCEKANDALQSIDARAERDTLIKVQKKSAELFMALENYVNPMGIKDFRRVSENEKILVRLHYVVMKCLYYFQKYGGYYNDMRCEGSYELSKKLMGAAKWENNFGAKRLWYNNELLFRKGILPGIQKIGLHPTLMQNIVRYLSNTILYPEYQGQQTYSYMKEYVQAVLYYLYDAPSSEIVYLDFI